MAMNFQLKLMPSANADPAMQESAAVRTMNASGITTGSHTIVAGAEEAVSLTLKTDAQILVEQLEPVTKESLKAKKEAEEAAAKPAAPLQGSPPPIAQQVGKTDYNAPVNTQKVDPKEDTHDTKKK